MSLSWENVLAVAEREQILPALNSCYRDIGIHSRLPPEIATVLSAVEELNLERNQAILNELALAASLLNQAGIEPVLLKGVAYFATGVYTNLAARYLHDVDLLIPASQLPAAAATLCQNGFVEAKGDRLCRFRHHHPPLRRPGQIPFELHHALGMGVCRSLLPASEVCRQSTPAVFLGARVRIPSPSHLMTHLILHSQIQHPYRERIWPPLRAIYDFGLLRRRFADEIDWPGIAARFRRSRQFGLLALHLLQVQQVLGEDPPFPIRLTIPLRLRWRRRQLLRAVPPLRFLDPLYLAATLLNRRLFTLQSAILSFTRQ